MKQIILTTFTILISFSFLFAQNGSIQRTVSDQTTNDKIPFAAVTLISDNESLQNGHISDRDGSFFLNNLKPGKYKLLVSNKEVAEIFYQTTDYFRNGGIVEFGIS